MLIITHSLRALESIDSRCCSTHSFASKIVLLCSTLVKAGREIAFMWVPGLCGTPGNETADSSAKMATSGNRHGDVDQVRIKTVNTCVSFADICRHLRDHFDNVWNAPYQSDPKGTSYKAVFPQRRKEDLRLVQEDTATLFRLSFRLRLFGISLGTSDVLTLDLMLQTNFNLAASFWGIYLLSAFIFLRWLKLASVSIFIVISQKDGDM